VGVVVGSLSPDERWYWDGQSWLAALSPDGHWRWDGLRWVPSTQHPRKSTWVPPWERSDTIRLAVAAFGVLVVLAALFIVLLWSHPEPGLWGAVLLVGLAVCGTGVGFGVRSRAGWPESFVLALTVALAIAALSVVAGVVSTDLEYDCSGRTTSSYRSECDNAGLGLGAAAIGASSYVVLVPFTLGGKAMARRHRQRMETED
jgi:hypothetical protein